MKCGVTELWLLVTEKMVLRVICSIAVGKINYGGERIGFVLVFFCFVFNPSHSFWEISVKKVKNNFVIADMQPHCALIEVRRKEPIDLLFYKRVRFL